MPDTRFREARWVRAGATDEQLEELRGRHVELDADEQAAEAVRIDSLSDDDLAAELDADDSDMSAGTMKQVLDRVGDDAELAVVAKSHEERKSKPRPKLVEALDAVIAGAGGG